MSQTFACYLVASDRRRTGWVHRRSLAGGLNSSNLITGRRRLGSFLICGLAAWREIFNLRDQLLPGSRNGRAESAVGDVDRADGDLAPEARGDVALRETDARLVVAGVNRLVPIDPIDKRKWGWINWAENNLRVRLPGLEVGKIDVPECAGVAWPLQEQGEYRLGPPACLRPIDQPPACLILRKGDAWNTVDDGFPNSRDCPGIMDIGSQVAACVDSCQDPVRPWGQVMQRKPDTIRGGAGHCHDTFCRSGHHDRLMGRDPMAAAGNRPARSNHRTSTETNRSSIQGGQTGRVPAIVVGQKQSWRGVGQGCSMVI